jgi:plasmid maintenance system antidote protein VapI
LLYSTQWTTFAAHQPQADTAIRLAQLFKTTPQFWMHMQANFDLKAAIGRRRSMKRAIRR